MSLTPQREKFAQAVASGMNQSDAYRAAYRVRHGTTMVSVNQSASRVMADVTDELRLPMTPPSEASRKAVDDALEIAGLI